ncbi:hypothetical protein KC19_6G181300 [Ceratodon purpureus]|uniref:Uncharacterized protein n=1 Tax=Ceratodon purpureus TaxID=3225 RepID=A0A8T0HG07_CERPU|nr:hypothetical protein KC19_6G181300 [Ceratodon purpureus]
MQGHRQLHLLPVQRPHSHFHLLLLPCLLHHTLQFPLPLLHKITPHPRNNLLATPMLPFSHESSSSNIKVTNALRQLEMLPRHRFPSSCNHTLISHSSHPSSTPPPNFSNTKYHQCVIIHIPCRIYYQTEMKML